MKFIQLIIKIRERNNFSRLKDFRQAIAKQFETQPRKNAAKKTAQKGSLTRGHTNEQSWEKDPKSR